MPRYDAASAECLVFTYKEGLLSPVAHDLKLRVGRFAVEVDADGAQVVATFDARSIEVVAAMRDGIEQPTTLSAKDKAQIVESIAKDVLATARWPEIRFQSRAVTPAAGGWSIRGMLSLAGRSRDLDAQARRLGDRVLVEVPIHQPDFGIKPFSAMMGAMKVKPRVDVRLSVPVP